MITARTAARLRAARVPVVLATALLTSLAAIPAALAASISSPATDCTGTIGAESVGRLTVPDGATCTLIGTTVGGNIVLGTHSSLITDGATINGSVRGPDGPARVRLIDTDVARNIMISGATGNIVIGPEDCSVDPVAGNNVKLRDNSGSIAICMMAIGENLELVDNTGRIGVYQNEVGNNLTADGNTGEASRFRGNSVGSSGGGNMTLTDNTTKMIVMDNHAGNHIACSGNTPDPVGSGNSADNGLTGQCAGLG